MTYADMGDLYNLFATSIANSEPAITIANPTAIELVRVSLYSNDGMRIPIKQIDKIIGA